MCDINSDKFKDLFIKADIEYDRFIRTTDNDHKNKVQQMWTKLSHCLSKGAYDGYYSMREEVFVAESELDENKVWTENGEKLELVKEENYLFKFRKETMEKVIEFNKTDRILPP